MVLNDLFEGTTAILCSFTASNALSFLQFQFHQRLGCEICNFREKDSAISEIGLCMVHFYGKDIDRKVCRGGNGKKSCRCFFAFSVFLR